MQDDGTVLGQHRRAEYSGRVPDASPTGWPSSFTCGETSTDIVSNAFNGFAVATPEDFLAFLKAVSETKPNSPKPTPIEQFLGTHPKAGKVVTTPKPTPISFVTERYFGVNAFLFTNKDGKARYGRYQFHPDAGEKFLTAEDAAKKCRTSSSKSWATGSQRALRSSGSSSSSRPRVTR